jgi:hypothetical protein
MAIEFEANYFRRCGNKCPIVQIEEKLAETGMSFDEAIKLLREKFDIVRQTDDEVLALCNRKISLSELSKNAYACCGQIGLFKTTS